MIGVATADLRNKVDQFNSSNSLCIDGNSSKLYIDGESHKQNFQINTGDWVTVQRSAQQI